MKLFFLLLHVMIPVVVADVCDPSPCQNGATCADVRGDATCCCSDGWVGTKCETREGEQFSRGDGTRAGCSVNAARGGGTGTGASGTSSSSSGGTSGTSTTTEEDKIVTLESKTAALESSLSTVNGKVSTLESTVAAEEAKVVTLESKTAALESTSTSEATKLETAEGTITSEAAKGKSNFYFSFVEIILFNQLIISSFSFFVISYL